MEHYLIHLSRSKCQTMNVDAIEFSERSQAAPSTRLVWLFKHFLHPIISAMHHTRLIADTPRHLYSPWEVPIHNRTPDLIWQMLQALDPHRVGNHERSAWVPIQHTIFIRSPAQQLVVLRSLKRRLKLQPSPSLHSRRSLHEIPDASLDCIRSGEYGLKISHVIDRFPAAIPSINLSPPSKQVYQVRVHGDER